MNFQEELSNSLLQNVGFIKTESEESMKCEDYLLQIKEETVDQEGFKSELLHEEYDVPNIKNEYDSEPNIPSNSGPFLDDTVIKKRIKKKRALYSCPICQKNFPTFLQRESHCKLHFKKNFGICSLCGKIFLHTEFYILHHITSHFLNTLKKQISQTNSKLENKESSAENIIHENFTSNTIYLKKKDCHVERRSLTCEICPKTFTSSNNLQKHTCVHKKENPVKCEICPKYFMASNDLKNHMYVHAGEKQLTCKMCSKRFAENEDLKMHIMHVHTGKKSFKCDTCFRSFIRKRNLTMHICASTGERPFKCEICSTRFKRNDTLVDHIYRVHLGEKPFECEICCRGFTHKGNLNVHMRVHTGEKPFKCEICFKPFTQSGSLRKHIRNVHTGKNKRKTGFS